MSLRNKIFHIFGVLGLAAICGSVITEGVFPHYHPDIYIEGIVNERILGSDVKSHRRFELNHMVVTEWGRVFVGAVNRIYEFDSALGLISEVETGPVNDSQKCLPGVECSFPKNMTDNYNMVLIHYKGLKEKLLTCGSVYQGACEARNLKNISRSHAYYESEVGSLLDYAVAANDPKSSTVGFIAPGPPDLQTEVLYVATTFSGGEIDVITQQLRGLVPAISTRSLGRNRFQLFEKTDSIQAKLSGIYIKKNVRSNYLIKYITGFSSSIYSYFLTQQYESPTETNSDSKIISKVIQICQEDIYYYSYIDMPLVCRSQTTGKEYNYIQAARVIQASKNLQLSFGLRSAEDILIGVFTDNSGGPDSNSAICVFTMQFIRKKLLENVQRCYSGDEALSGGGYLTQKRCQKLVSKTPSKLFTFHERSAKIAWKPY